MADHPIPFEDRQTILSEMEAWRNSLPPSPIPEELTGLLPRALDPRDSNLAHDPKVAAMMAVGFPETNDLARLLPSTYNQGSTPSCVSHTAAAMSSAHEMQERGTWVWFDGPRMHRETGAEGEGRWPEQIFKVCQERGMPRANTEERFKIAAYAFVQPDAGWESTVKAAVAAGKFLGLAMLLPSYFSYESSGSITSGYHEVLICGYDRTRLLIKNSWGAGWGKDGFGWIPIAFLEQSSFQNGYVLVHALTDERLSPDPTPIPDPLPDPTPDPLPDPTPRPVTITGYRTTQTVPAVKQNEELVIEGTGFDSPGVLMVQWGAYGLTIRDRTAQALTVQAPDTRGLNAVSLRLEGTVVEGPLLGVMTQVKPDPEPDPDPDPDPEPEPGNLSIRLVLKRVRPGSEWLGVVAYLDMQHAGSGRALVLVNGRDLNQARSVGNNGIATWLVKVPMGATIRVDGRTADGRAGSATKSEG